VSDVGLIFASGATINHQSMRRKLKKLCAFCLRPAQMSGEHLWSAWIGKLLADYKGVYSFRTGISWISL
jgi:hypothetical protein